jgi:hypothetical protein
MLTRRQFSMSVSAAAAVTSAQPGTAAQAAVRPGRRAEVEALRAFAEKTHPRGREASANAIWRSRWDRLAANADSFPDGAYFIALRQALGWFADGHTTPLPFEFTGGVPATLKGGAFGLSLPLKIGIFHDGAFVVAASSAQSGILGKRILRIGSLSVEEIVRANAKDWPGNKAWAHRWAGYSLASPAHLQGLGAIADPRQAVPITVDGRTILVGPETAAADLIALTRPATLVERWNGEFGRGLFVKPLPDRRALYLSIDDMADATDYSFIQFTRDTFAALAQEQHERVILDLRRNGGGNNFFGEALRKRLGASRFNRPGGLYVLIGPKTFSAAQNLANRLERETFATFVGEPTGGAPNHFGDAEMFTGPATGIAAIVSTLPWFDSYPQDDRPWILPDLPVPESFSTWTAGEDPALAAALGHHASPGDELSRERIFYYERPSQKGEWKPFWG